MKALKIPLTPEARAALSFQRYDAPPEIAGVRFTPLRKHRALEGAFMEYLRLTGGKVEGFDTPFEVRQVSVSWAAPGRINAFHVHPKEVQDEVWCVVEGTLLVWLVDVREGSSTRGVRRRYVLSGEEPGLLYIPSGVAHGYRAGPEGAVLLYAMNNQFNPEDPNEGRLPWDFFGAELWEEDRG
ncbi:dTDP-4-dehydrorhamnose 3,5-epimerase family protein [Marinithermus hydrothermalis]|uniref:dTDP-4-dehydrorhamnose 35-epimerase related protein n=1 Tax=Marinithermus hydrothermalis (strain DSM 14884 / JCM 11576 / T1) TaxID=869210 RepID=F2NR06_MARHT|nr:dTDP-4-dehydrorhamnose 3,5-epimerase family protein [Marinithermus hydrothermalis]AEB12584.1 dTDP-4-dehydrorhamnose 35-epimerase related protein [Marinithermus hydrothermalis DSM 14884]